MILTDNGKYSEAYFYSLYTHHYYLLWLDLAVMWRQHPGELVNLRSLSDTMKWRLTLSICLCQAALEHHSVAEFKRKTDVEHKKLMASMWSEPSKLPD